MGPALPTLCRQYSLQCLQGGLGTEAQGQWLGQRAADVLPPPPAPLANRTCQNILKTPAKTSLKTPNNIPAKLFPPDRPTCKSIPEKPPTTPPQNHSPPTGLPAQTSLKNANSPIAAAKASPQNHSP